MRKFLSLFAAVLVAFVANAAVINITNETPDALRIALGNAETGDIIEMAAGTYVESNSNYIAFDGKIVTVKAAEGAEVIIQPQVPFTISNGATAIFENIKIDASRLNELADWYEHLIYAADATENNLVMDGCEIYNFLPNKSMIYCSSANTFSSIVFDECYFHNIMKSILFVENSSANIGVSLTNSTIANISTNTESYWAGVMDVRAAGASLMVDHCTYYNVIPMNTDYSAVSKITLANGLVSNCIFMLPTAQDGIRAMRGVTATNCITFNYLKDNGTGIHSSVTQNNCVQADPLFVDAANGDFTLGEGSPALTMNDGQPIGDPRWVAAAPVTPTLENGFYLVGSFNSWAPAAEYHLVGNPDNNAEFMINVTLAENDELKVVNVLDGNITAWFPGGDNYVVDAAHAGDKTVYFRPDYQGGEDWFSACIYIAPNAEPQPAEMTVIYDLAAGIGSTILNGAEVANVKIHTNTDEISAIKFSSSAHRLAIKPAEGAFQAGDSIFIAVCFNNSDDTKQAQIRAFAADGTTQIFESAQGVNGRTSADDPIVQAFALEAAQDSILFARQGNTATYITFLKAVRAEGGDEPQPQECDWDAIDFLGDGSPEQAFANQFKICKAGEQPNVVNIQKPGFAAESGIYVSFPSAEFGEISLAEGQYVIDGAGMVLYCSAFTQEYTEVTVNCQNQDIVFTVYNAKAGVVPAEHSYTVAGSSADLFGTTWDPANTANDMIKLEDGTYKWEMTEVTLPAGSIEFKVCEDHAWTHCYPAENYSMSISEAGIYTITITYNPEGNVVAGDALKTGDAQVDPVVSIAGSMNGWNTSADVMVLADDKATASLTLSLTAATYEFKVVLNGGDWRSNAQEFTRENATAAGMSGNLDNMRLVADEAGEYTFTWTFETNTLSIAFPVGSGISNTAVDAKAIKRIVNGQLFIEMNGVLYNAQGTIVR